MQLLAQVRWSRKIVRYLQTKISKLLIIVTRCCIRHDILFRWDPEWEDFNIIDCRNEKYALKRDNCWALDGVFINRINNTRIITGKTDFPSSPALVPKEKGVKNCKYLIPIDLFRLMS